MNVLTGRFNGKMQRFMKSINEEAAAAPPEKIPFTAFVYIQHQVGITLSLPHENFNGMSGKYLP